MRDRTPIAQSTNATRSLRELCAGFGSRLGSVFDEPAFHGDVDVVDPVALPASYRKLLAHDRHMTTTLRSHFGDELALRVLADRTDGTVYRRCVELALARSGAVVEIGVVRLELSNLDAAARAEILARRKLLGDILIGSGVLTRVDVRWYLRFARSCGMVGSLAGGSHSPVFGRIATIHCNGSPALELLEVVTDDPEPVAGA